MSRIIRWSGVPVTYSSEITDELLEKLPLVSHVVLERYLYNEVAGEGANLVIEAKSKGYYDPGVTYGDPGRCYPPEGDDERELVEAYVQPDVGARVDLHPVVQQELFDALYQEVASVELPNPERGD